MAGASPRERSDPPSWLPGLDRAGQVLLLALLAFLTVAYGGVQASAGLVLRCAALLLAAILLVRAFASREGLARSPACVLLVGFALLSAGLLLPWPRSLLAAVAPQRLWLEESFAAASGLRSEGALVAHCFPHAGLTELGTLLALLVILVAGLQYGRDPRSRLLLLRGATGILALLVASALWQHVLGEHTIFGVAALPERSSYAGTFVHYGHFAQAIGLGVGAALAWLLHLAVQHGWSELRCSPLAVALALLFVVALGLVVLSGARAGILAVCFASVLLLFRARSLGLSRSVVSGALGAAVLLFVALLILDFDALFARWAELGSGEPGARLRLEIWRDSLRAVPDAWLLGHGLGSFELAFPMYDHAMRAGTAAHAENLWIELLFESGVLGLALLSGLGFVVLRAGLRATRGRARVESYGIAFGLLCVLVPTLTDFGARVPAIAGSALLLVGLLLAPEGRTGGSFARRHETTLLLVLAGAGLGATLPHALRSWRAEAERPATPEALARVGRILVEDPRLAFRGAARAWEQAVAEQRATPELASELRGRVLAASRWAPSHGPMLAFAGALGREVLGRAGDAELVFLGRLLAPQHPAVCLAAAREWLRSGEEELAVLEFRRAVRVGADADGLFRELIFERRRPELALRVASAEPAHLLWVVRRLEPALAAFPDTSARIRSLLRQALEKHTESPAAPGWMLQALAVEYARIEDPRAALSCYERLLRLEPRSVDRAAYAALLAQVDRPAAAIREYRRHLELHPGDRAARRRLEALLLEDPDENRE